MAELNFKNIISQISGLQLTSVKLACEMLIFNFEGSAVYALHSQCLTRIIKNGDILLTTLDYQSWDEENSENNDEWYNLNKFENDIVGGKVESVDLNDINDLAIKLNNRIKIELFISNGYNHYDEEREQYRFFEVIDDEHPKNAHYVVYSKHIEKQI